MMRSPTQLSFALLAFLWIGLLHDIAFAQDAPKAPQSGPTPSSNNISPELSPSFWRFFESGVGQNLVVVGATALLGGLIIPIVKSGMDLRYFREQKKHENDLAKQSKLVEQQTEFLKGYIDIVWKFHFSMVKVTYFLASDCSEEDFNQVWKAYGKESWEMLQEFRRIISTSIYLVSDQRFQRLLKQYKEFIERDKHLTSLVEYIERNENDWSAYHKSLFYEFARELDSEIEAIACELGLKVKTN